MMQLSNDDTRMDFHSMRKLVYPSLRIQRPHPNDERLKLVSRNQYIGRVLIRSPFNIWFCYRWHGSVADKFRIDGRIAVFNVRAFVEERKPEGINTIEPQRHRN